MDQKNRRIYNVNVAYLRENLKDYKKKTGVNSKLVFDALGVSKSFVSNMSYNGADACNLFKLCAILGVMPDDERLFIGGKPVFIKPKKVEEDQIEMEVVKDPIQALREEVNALHNENEALRRAVALLEAEMDEIRGVML